MVIFEAVVSIVECGVDWGVQLMFLPLSVARLYWAR